MSRLVACALLSVPLLLAGCGESANDTLVKDILAVHDQLATDIDKAEDPPAYTQAMNQANERIMAVSKRLQAMSPERQKAFQASYGKQLSDSDLRLQEAMARYRKRLVAGPHPVVVIDTSEGPIRVELYEKLAPITVQNFLSYVNDKFYDGTIFHRVIPNFMIQGGGFEPGMKEKTPRAPITNESSNGLSNERGTIAMARTNVADSATAQFYINVRDNPNLDKAMAQDGVGYAVFGKVIDGMDVVDKIKAVPTAQRGGHGDVPVQDVMIKSVRREQK
jgi:cyclophilin family peptidyl-prolyl cis-trans isomerase/outer membrane murein-binding lipoprotein Lpp